MSRAPIEVSSGNRTICRLSRRGNRRLNHATHIAAVTQIRQRLWGANTPSWRLTCDILSQPKLSRRTRAHYFREPRASPKGHRRTIGGYTNGLYKDHVRCGPDAAGVTGRVDRSSSSCAVVPGQP